MVSLGHNELTLKVLHRTVNTLRPRQNGRQIPDHIFKWIFLNENIWISINITLKFVPKGSINNIPALVQIMAWRRPGNKPLSEPMITSLLTHIYVTRPQWVNIIIKEMQPNPIKVLQFLCIVIARFDWGYPLKKWFEITHGQRNFVENMYMYITW